MRSTLIRRCRRAFAAALFALVGTAFAPHAAHATHTTTPCNNDAGNLDEVYVAWHSVVLVGVDAGLPPDSGRAVCVFVVSTHAHILVDVLTLSTSPSKPGLTLGVRLCTPTCSIVLAETGVVVNTTAPLFSCVWVNGTQQIPGCSP